MEKQPNTSELLATVKTLYLQEDFAGAVQALTKNPQSLPPEIWHYNLGTLHLKNGNWGMGRFHLEKASKAGFVGDMNFKNLSMVKAREEVVDLYRSESLLERTLDYTLLFPASSYVILTPLILAVLLLLWVRLKALKLKFLNSLSFLLIVCAPALFYFLFLGNLQEAIVIETTEVREGPSQIYSENTVLPAASKVIIGKQSGDWFLVKYPRQVVGWIDGQKLGFLDEK